MKHFISIPLFLLLTACGAEELQPPQQRLVDVDGNRLQITSGMSHKARYVKVENVDRIWKGKFKGRKEKWKLRKELFEFHRQAEMERVCGAIFYQVIGKPKFGMMDKDETMGGVAPVLGVAASMAAYAVAYSNTDDSNIPVSVYSEFRCPKDEEQ